MAGLGHLASRFFGSLLPFGPVVDDAAWAFQHLMPAEQAVWARMSAADRRHAAGVARRTVAALGDDIGREVVAAALLHDAGKLECGLGTFGRVVATVAAMASGREKATSWSHGQGIAARMDLYIRHPELGSALLASAGSHPLTSAWAGEHHLPEARWTVPLDVGRALKAADDD